MTVFVVDDDRDIRSSICRALELRGYVTACYGSARDFLDAFDGSRSGCLILDYGMPDMNGLELQKELAERGLSIPIVYISGHGGVPETVQAIKAGALDFLQKPFRTPDLVDRIEAGFVIARDWQAAAARARHLQVQFDSLTRREKQVAERMMARPSAISSKEIAAELGISPRTVDHHRARILEKLNLRSVAELTALRKG